MRALYRLIFGGIFVLIILMAFVFAVRPSSIIYNYDAQTLSGNLTIKVQKLNGAVWNDVQIVVSQIISVNPGSSLSLANLWDAAGGYLANDIGNFRVYADVKNSSGQIIQTANGYLNNSWEFAVSASDIIPPYVAFVSPLNQTYINTNNITISITNSSDAFRVWWYNGTRNLSYVNPVNLTLANSQYTFIAYANDSAGNLNFTSVTFTLIIILLILLIQSFQIIRLIMEQW